MAITKRFEYDVQVLPDGRLQHREITIIEEDGVELSRKNHRKVIEVGADVSGEDQLTRDIAASVHTPERIAARQAVIAAQADLDPGAPPQAQIP